MIRLDHKDFKKVAKLVRAEDELSVFSVIYGQNPGDIYVNNVDNPTVALIKTSECNLIAGSTKDDKFNSEISSQLDFWDQLVPDSEEWIDMIPIIHKNRFIRKYKRRRYILSSKDFIECDMKIKEGYILERVDISILRRNIFENSDKILDWVEDWGSDEEFEKYGMGYLIRNGKTIVSWSLSDCSFQNKIAIGIYTDERYRHNGFGRAVVTSTIKGCFSGGYTEVQWLCVDSNKGSRAIAEKSGFTLKNFYYSFSSYAPIENLEDLSEEEWHGWGEYLESSSREEECLIWEALYAYIKSNDVEKTINIMINMKTKGIAIDYLRFKNYIINLQNYGICSNFNNKIWIDFLNKNMG